MKRSSFLSTIAFIMFGASFSALIVSLLIILATLGRPDHALLRAAGEVAVQGLNCQQPAQSGLFQVDSPPVADPRLPRLDYLLLDSDGRVLGQRWPSEQPAARPQIKHSERQFLSLWRDLVALPQVTWVTLEDVCKPGWSLVIQDTKGALFQQLMFRRQALLYFISCTILSLVAFSLAYYLLRKGQEARAVMIQLRSGNLKARLPRHRFERFLDLVTEFNHMVGAIESLVETIQNHEIERREWLGNLAHDLRTPLASLSTAVETLHDFDESLKGEPRQKIFTAMLDDLSYFQQLLDDIFFLAFLQGTRRPLQKEWIDLGEALQKWLPIWRDSALAQGRQLSLSFAAGQDYRVHADAHLLRRMFQNIIDNALRYSISWVHLKLKAEENTIVFQAENDAHELASDELKAWGQKRQQRRIADDPSRQRTSLGLGSSIIQEIARLHNGEAALTQALRQAECLVMLTLRLPRYRGETNSRELLVLDKVLESIEAVESRNT